jgi:hypothetical protein
MPQILKGSTDVTRYVMLRDSAAGTPETGYTITNLDLQYTRNRSAPATKVDATALAATNSAHGDNQAIEVDGTSSPGLYRIDWPDAAFATGVDKVILTVSGTGLDPAVEEIQLVNYNPEDGVRLGLTALPNAAADAPGGLPISDAGGLDLDTFLGRITGNVALASVLGALADAAADGDPTNTDTVVAYVKQLINTLVGTTGIPTWPSAAAPGNNVSIAEALRSTYDASGGGSTTCATTGRIPR